ncbi:MAG: MbnP family copper-binding protein [Deltaproteobacteria bacterium]
MRLRCQHSPLLWISLHFFVLLACSAPDASVRDSRVLLGSSRGEPPDAPAPASQAVRLRFVARVGNEPFACGSTYRSSLGSDFTPADLRLFVQDVALIDGAGNEQPVQLDVRGPWQIDGVALIDFEDASAACLAGTRERNLELTGHVPPGEYRGIEFSNGVPEALNHADPSRLPAPLQAGSMSWGWLQGYRFVMAEITSSASLLRTAAPGSALFHLGSTACGGNPSAGGIACAKPNRNRVRLPEFDPAADAIVVDLAELFADMDLATVTTCHSSGDACAPLFERLGLDLSNGLATDRQRVYRVEPASVSEP